MPNYSCNNKLFPNLGAASVDTGGRSFAGGGPGDISPHWQARKGVTGGQGTDGNRNGTSSQTIADFFHDNEWVKKEKNCVLFKRSIHQPIYFP